MLNPKQRNFVDISSISSSHLRQIIDKAILIKQSKHIYNFCENKIITAFFGYPSTRTRMSFFKAANLVSAKINIVNATELHLSRGEAIEDIAKMFELYSDLLVIRHDEHDAVQKISELISIPVINALTNQSHPCQALADIMTLIEKFKDLNGKTVAWICEDNNTFRSLAELANIYGLKINLCFDKRYIKDPNLTSASLNNIQIFDEPAKACKDVIAIFTDSWNSLGFADKSQAEVDKLIQKFQVQPEMFLQANQDAIFMHCLPMHHDVEVSLDVINSKACGVWQEADNRTYTQAALLAYCFNKLDMIN